MNVNSDVKLERAPLQFVLVQIRFSAIKSMSRYVPDIQERLRTSGFPRFDEEQVQQFTIGAQTEPTLESFARWRFLDHDKKQGVILSDESIIFETCQYDVFSSFVEQVATVLKELASITQIDYVKQIGLRYINLVTAQEQKSPCWFTRECLRGLSSDSLSGAETENQFISRIKTPSGRLTVRMLEGKGTRFMPPDLMDTKLEFSTETGEKDNFRTLDFDHIWKGEMSFSSNDIEATMNELHEKIEETFKETVTEAAIALWKSKDKDNG